jgi:DNA-binding beta-propeller fold protein YncE
MKEMSIQPLLTNTIFALSVALLFLMATPTFVMAQETTKLESPTPTGKNGAIVTAWATGLKGPQGILRHGDSVLVIENTTGTILRFPLQGGASQKFAEGLKNPAFALSYKDTLLVAERTGNSVAHVSAQGEVTRLNGTISDPLGMSLTAEGTLLVLSHRESTIWCFRPSDNGWIMDSKPFATPKGGTKYGWRDMAIGKDGSLYITDELSNTVLVRRPGADFAPLGVVLSSPSGLTFSPDGVLYVTEEGTGRLSRLTTNGTVEVLAEGMGKAREAVFLDPKTVLVTDRAGGNIWKVTLP